MAKPAPPDPNELVHITNPNLPGTATAITSRQAFDQIWAGKGFEIVDVASGERDPSEPLPDTVPAPDGDAPPASEAGGGTTPAATPTTSPSTTSSSGTGGTGRRSTSGGDS